MCDKVDIGVESCCCRFSSSSSCGGWGCCGDCCVDCCVDCCWVWCVGREAKNGDKIVKLEGGKVVAYGVLHSAVPGNNYCNGNIAVIQPVNDYACICIVCMSIILKLFFPVLLVTLLSLPAINLFAA